MVSDYIICVDVAAAFFKQLLIIRAPLNPQLDATDWSVSSVFYNNWVHVQDKFKETRPGTGPLRRTNMCTCNITKYLGLSKPDSLLVLRTCASVGSTHHDNLLLQFSSIPKLLAHTEQRE